MKKKNIIQPRTEEGIPVEVYRTAKPLFDSTHAPEFSQNNPVKPTGMALRIINAVKRKLDDLNFQGDGTPQLSAAIQQNEKDAAKNEELMYLQHTTKLVHFSAGAGEQNNKAFRITPAEFYERLGIVGNHRQQEEFKEQLLKLGKTPYKFSWPYTAANGKKMRAEKETPFFFVEQHFEQLEKPRVFPTTDKEGKMKMQEINEILEFYVIEPGHICWLGADAPAEEVKSKKPIWIKQAYFPTEHLTAGQAALFQFIYGEYQKGKAAANKKKQAFNRVRNYSALDLMQYMNINTASPSFKAHKSREMKRLEEALILFKEQAWLEDWERTGDEVRVVLPSALLEGMA
jgi:hypothetical protein